MRKRPAPYKMPMWSGVPSKSSCPFWQFWYHFTHFFTCSANVLSAWNTEVKAKKKKVSFCRVYILEEKKKDRKNRRTRQWAIDKRCQFNRECNRIQSIGGRCPFTLVGWGNFFSNEGVSHTGPWGKSALNRGEQDREVHLRTEFQKQQEGWFGGSRGGRGGWRGYRDSRGSQDSETFIAPGMLSLLCEPGNRKSFIRESRRQSGLFDRKIFLDCGLVCRVDWVC